jgi:hypothetical protein
MDWSGFGNLRTSIATCSVNNRNTWAGFSPLTLVARAYWHIMKQVFHRHSFENIRSGICSSSLSANRERCGEGQVGGKTIGSRGESQALATQLARHDHVLAHPNRLAAMMSLKWHDAPR